MRRALPLAAALAAALLAGCASAPTTIYTLDPTAPAAPPATLYAGPPVRVDAVNVPPALNRLELVTVTGAERLEIHDLSHWAGPLGELARRALTADLQARLPQGSVVFPASPKPPGARGLVVDILSVTPSSQGTVMDASWSLLPSVTGGAVRQRTLRVATPAAAGPGALAADLSALMGRLADAIGADLAADPPRAAPPPPPPPPPPATEVRR